MEIMIFSSVEMSILMYIVLSSVETNMINENFLFIYDWMKCNFDLKKFVSKELGWLIKAS